MVLGFEEITNETKATKDCCVLMRIIHLGLGLTVVFFDFSFLTAEFKNFPGRIFRKHHLLTDLP